jgi:hypothetical protein
MPSLKSLVLVCLVSGSQGFAADKQDADALLSIISAKDSEAFDAFNKCSEPAQLAKHESYFAPDVEFYHDTGGVTWNRASMLENTKRYACGNYTRELITGSFKVYPIKGFGAVSQGSHRFCTVATGKCDGLADFTIVWHQTGTQWVMTRVLSYGHRPATTSEK